MDDKSTGFIVLGSAPTVPRYNNTNNHKTKLASHENTMKFEIAPKSTEIQAKWIDAKLYCFSLTIDGKIDWRLPTRKELKQIFAIQNDYEIRFYWSGDENPTDARCACTQSCEDGKQYKDSDKRLGFVYARAIRDVKDN